VCVERLRDLSKEVRLALTARMNHARHPTRPLSAKLWAARNAGDDVIADFALFVTAVGQRDRADT